MVPPARPAEGAGARSAALRSGSAAPLPPPKSAPRLCRSAAARPGSAAEAPFRQGLIARICNAAVVVQAEVVQWGWV